MTETVPAWVSEAVSEELGKPITRTRRVIGVEGGYSDAIRRVVEFPDSTAAFVKISTEPGLSNHLRHEIKMYDELDEPFMLTKLGHVDCAEGVVLILENAERAAWPPPWNEPQINEVIAMLDRLRRVEAPEWLYWLQGPGALISSPSGWELVAENPGRFLASGIASPEWLERNLESLMAAGDLNDLEGGAFVHLDVRSDNICFIDGQIRLIDWSAARYGNPRLDQNYWASTLSYETRHRHDELLMADATSHLVMLAGHYAAAIGRRGPHGLLASQDERASDQLRSLLPWACELAGIGQPDDSRR